MQKTSILTLAALLVVAPLARAAEPTMTDMIGSAKTAADHEALAAAYTKQAEEAKAHAAEHDAMGKTYSGALREKLHFEEHCRAIAADFRSMAKDFEAMAAAHRTLAKQAAKQAAK